MISARQGCVSGWLAAALFALLAAGCAGPEQSTASQAAETVTISDPVVAFAAAASPGAEENVVLAGTGQGARLRLVRSYAAASGRECREVEVRTGGGANSRLLCRAGTGWRDARPLIRGGAARR